MRFFIIFLLFIHLFSNAQQKSSFVISGIVNDHDGISIPSVKVSFGDHFTFTNNQGEYFIKVYKKDPLNIVFKHVGFIEETITIKKGLVRNIQISDTLKFKKVILNDKLLNEITITSKKIDTIFGNERFSVEDFELVDNDRMILLVYEKNLKKGSKIVLTDKQQKMIHSYVVPSEAICLFKDFADRVYVITDAGVFYVKVKSVDKKITLISVEDKDFYGFYHRVIDTLDNQYFYSNYNELYPEVNFYSTLKNDTSNYLLRKVRDDFMMELYRAQFKYVSGRNKLWAYRKEQETGIDKEIWIGASFFTQDILYQPVYAPLFVKEDTVLIFDHYNDKLFKYDINRKPVDSLPISHHLKNSKDKWNEPLVQDPISKKIFGIYHKGGITILKSIDLNTGKPIHYFELAYRYIEKVKVIDGYVYYIYRPFESIQKKFLYREKL